MLIFRAIAPRLNLPSDRALWLLEGGIALVLSAYMIYQCYRPFAQALNRSFETQAGGIIAILLLLAILLPLLWLLLAILVLLMAGLLPLAMRKVLDVLALTFLITVLILPSLRDVVNAAQSQQTEFKLADRSQPPETGPLNAAPSSLKIERIPLGVEVTNAGAQPLDISVLFVRLNERGRLYCAGKALSSQNIARSRLEAGAHMIFTSGNCQNGDVALTVWDTTGRRIYQTSAISPPDQP